MAVTLRGFSHDKKGRGRNGVLVRVYALGSDTPTASTYTEDHASGEPGYWHFDALADGDYRVDVEWNGEKAVTVFIQ